MIYATLVVPICFLSIVTPVTPKSRSNPRQLLHPCQMHPRCKFGDHRSVACRDNADISIYYDALKPRKIGHSDLVFGVRSGCASGSAHTRLQVSVCTGYVFFASYVLWCRQNCKTAILVGIFGRLALNMSQTLVFRLHVFSIQACFKYQISTIILYRLENVWHHELIMASMQYQFI